MVAITGITTVDGAALEVAVESAPNRVSREVWATEVTLRDRANLPCPTQSLFHY